MRDANSPQLAEGSKEGQRRDAGKRGAAERVGLRGSDREAVPLKLRLEEGAGSRTLVPARAQAGGGRWEQHPDAPTSHPLLSPPLWQNPDWDQRASTGTRQGGWSG